MECIYRTIEVHLNPWEPTTLFVLWNFNKLLRNMWQDLMQTNVAYCQILHNLDRYEPSYSKENAYLWNLTWIKFCSNLSNSCGMVAETNVVCILCSKFVQGRIWNDVKSTLVEQLQSELVDIQPFLALIYGHTPANLKISNASVWKLGSNMVSASSMTRCLRWEKLTISETFHDSKLQQITTTQINKVLEKPLRK